MKFSYRSKLTLLIFALVFSALSAVTTFFLNLYREEKLSVVYETELSTTQQLVTTIENLILIGTTSELEKIRKSRDLVFVSEDPCGPLPTTVISDVFSKTLADLKLSPESWLRAEEIHAQCTRLQSTLPTAGAPIELTQVFQPGLVGPRLYMPTLLALVPGHGAVKPRLLLLSLDGTGTDSGDHAYFLAGPTGAPVWSDTSPVLLEALQKATGVGLATLVELVAETARSGVPSIGRKGTDGIVAYAPSLPKLTLISLNSEQALLRSIDFMLRQSLLLVGGFLFTCFFVGRLFAVRMTRPLNELRLAAEAIGSGDFTHQLVITETDEISIIKRSFNSMTSKIVQLVSDTKDQAMIESDIKVAQQVQQMLLPPPLSRAAGHELASFVQMAQKCGGDWWGYAEVPVAGRNPMLLMLIGDVTGHGVSSALLTAAAQGGLSVLSTFLEPSQRVSATLVPELAKDPRLALHIFNRAVFQSGGGTLSMSFFACLIDVDAQELYTANAGHNKPYLIDAAGKLTSLGPSGPVLGKVLNEEFPEIETHPWLPGSQLFLYTDGLIDCYQGDRNLFERKHLVRLLKSAGPVRGTQLLQKIMAERAKMIENTPPEDDVTAVVVSQLPGAIRPVTIPRGGPNGGA